MFLAAVICLAYVVLRDSWSSILSQVRQTPVHVILAAVICSFLYNCFDGCALTKLFRTTRKDFSYRQGILCSFYYSFYRTLTLGSGTVPAGIHYVSRQGIPAERSLEVFTINYIIQRITICLYFVTGFLLQWSRMKELYQDYTVYIILGVLVTIIVASALIVVCVCEPLHRVAFRGAKACVRKYEQKHTGEDGITEKTVTEPATAGTDTMNRKETENGGTEEPGLRKRLRGRKKLNTGKLMEIIEEWENKAAIIRREAKLLLTSMRLLVEVLLFTAGKLTMWYIIPVFVYGTTKPAEIALVITVAAMSSALASVIPTPGGVGAVEAVFCLLFTPIVGKVSAVSGMLIYRLATFLLPVVFGIPVLIWVMIKEK